MIYLIRHGEAAAKWGDHPDPGLSDAGHKQASAAARSLHELGCHRVVSSPMTRCRETADHFAKLLGTDPTIEPRVSEIGTPADVPDRRVWLTAFLASNWADVDNSYLSWRDDLIAAVQGLEDGTAVFSHFVAINALCSALMGHQNIVVFRPDYCSITTLERADGTLSVRALGKEQDTIIR